MSLEHDEHGEHDLKSLRKKLHAELLSRSDTDDVTDDVPDDELLLSLHPVKLIKNTSLYVVSINGKPSFYVKDETTASNLMWNTIKILSSDYILNGYHTNIIDLNNCQLTIIGRYNFFLFACEKPLDTVSYTKVYESC